MTATVEDRDDDRVWPDGAECEWAGHDDRVSATGSCPVCGGSYLL